MFVKMSKLLKRENRHACIAKDKSVNVWNGLDTWAQRNLSKCGCWFFVEPRSSNAADLARIDHNLENLRRSLHEAHSGDHFCSHHSHVRDQTHKKSHVSRHRPKIESRT